MIQTKLIIPKYYSRPTKTIEVEEAIQQYGNTQSKTPKTKIIHETVFDEDQAKDFPKEVIEYFKKNEKSGYGSYSYTELLDVTLNRWLEKFHLEIVAKKHDGFKPDNKQPHIVDIKFQIGTEGEYSFDRALVIFEDGN